MRKFFKGTWDQSEFREAIWYFFKGSVKNIFGNKGDFLIFLGNTRTEISRGRVSVP